MTSLGVAEIDNLSSCVEFYLECKKADIKPIIGIRHKDKICFAKNKDGYKELLNLCYDINSAQTINWKEWASRNIAIKDLNCELDLPSPRFLKDQKRLFDIAYATKEHAKVSDIQNKLAEFDNDYFGFCDTDKKQETERFAEECEQYDITGSPLLPFYENNEDNSGLFRKLCERQLNIEFPNDPIYRDRLEMELAVLQGANLENYFLILKDIMDWARKEGYLLGAARGSSAGCLVSYLLGVTQINPIEYNLIFSRFYNAGRNADGNISYPDIDVDFPQRSRKYVIEYITKKYGVERVCKIATHGTFMGRSALSAVLRSTSNIGFTELKNITKNIKDKAAISDELQTMVENGDKKSVILWGLQNEPTKFEDYCQLKNGKLEGDYADAFDLAIDLEETKCNRSEHAAGIVIAKNSLRDSCPMVRNHDYLISGLEMTELEAAGFLKYDLLGVSSLDRLEDI